MSVYPRNLSNFLNRLSGYNKNNVKMNVLGSDSAKHGQTVQVELPTNSIVDLSSLAWVFKVLYTNPGDGKKMHLPIQAETLIDRLAVEVNGQTLVNLQNYNVLFNMLLYQSATEDYQRQRNISQANMAGDAANGSCEEVTGGADATDAADIALRTRHHVIDSWLGFLGTAKPQFIDTSLLGNVRITITLASEGIINGDGTDTPTSRGFELSDQFFTCDVISISDGIYDAMVDQRLASGAPIEIPFKNYFSYTQQNGANMGQMLNFNVASQSIDRLWATARNRSHANANHPKVAVATPAHAIMASAHPAMRLRSCGGKDFQFQINQTLYPNYISDKAGVWQQQLRNAMGEQGNMLSGSFSNSLTQYQDFFFAFAVSLEHKTDSDERYMSGIDTRGAAASCHFKASAGGPGTAVANQTLVFAECTSCLKVMANKVLEVVQ